MFSNALYKFRSWFRGGLFSNIPISSNIFYFTKENESRNSCCSSKLSNTALMVCSLISDNCKAMILRILMFNSYIFTPWVRTQVWQRDIPFANWKIVISILRQVVVWLGLQDSWAPRCSKITRAVSYNIKKNELRNNITFHY